MHFNPTAAATVSVKLLLVNWVKHSRSSLRNSETMLTVRLLKFHLVLNGRGTRRLLAICSSADTLCENLEKKVGIQTRLAKRIRTFLFHEAALCRTTVNAIDVHNNEQLK